MLKTLMPSKSTTYVLLAVSVILHSFSIISTKFAALSKIPLNYLWILLAFGFLGIRSIAWQWLLTHNELSKVFPYNSLVQVCILIASVFLFNETITIFNIYGIILIMGGIIVIGVGK